MNDATIAAICRVIARASPDRVVTGAELLQAAQAVNLRERFDVNGGCNVSWHFGRQLDAATLVVRPDGTVAVMVQNFMSSDPNQLTKYAAFCARLARTGLEVQRAIVKGE